jgi:ABC-type taurine transport system ATPase subunit
MALLEMRAASYARGGRTVVPATTLSLGENERIAHACGDSDAAMIIALLAAGLVKPSSGRVFVAAFDPRIQPVQVKRIVGFVPHEALPHDFPSFTRYIEFRATLWGLPRAQSVVRARALLARLEGVHEAFAYPLIGALLSQPRLLVLDRPQAAYAQQILEVAHDCAIFSTHVSERDAQRFAAQAVPV